MELIYYRKEYENEKEYIYNGRFSGNGYDWM